MEAAFISGQQVWHVSWGCESVRMFDVTSMSPHTHIHTQTNSLGKMYRHPDGSATFRALVTKDLHTSSPVTLTPMHIQIKWESGTLVLSSHSFNPVIYYPAQPSVATQALLNPTCLPCCGRGKPTPHTFAQHFVEGQHKSRTIYSTESHLSLTLYHICTNKHVFFLYLFISLTHTSIHSGFVECACLTLIQLILLGKGWWERICWG